jgi:hypothetical protein
MDGYKYFSGLSVHWVIVGPSGRDVRPASGGVLRHYQVCANQANQGTKIIANTYYVSAITAHPHNMRFRCVMPSLSSVSPCLL